MTTRILFNTTTREQHPLATVNEQVDYTDDDYCGERLDAAQPSGGGYWVCTRDRLKTHTLHIALDDARRLCAKWEDEFVIHEDADLDDA